MCRWTYLESFSTQVPAAMPLQLRETDGKLFQTDLGAIRERTGGRKIWIILAVLVKHFSTFLSHILVRLKRKQDSTMQSTNLQRYCVGCALGGWRGHHTRQLKHTRSKKQHKLIIISTPNMQCTSYLSALMVPLSRNTDLQWQSRS